MILDISLGLLLAWLFSYNGWVEMSWPVLLLACVSTLLPDLDFPVWLAQHKWRTNRWTYQHRDLLHYPMILPFVWGGLAWMVSANPGLGGLAAAGVLAHFVHDTVGGAWGIRWLYPFWGGYVVYRRLPPDAPKSRWVFLNRMEQDHFVHVYGNDKWLTAEAASRRTLAFECGTLALAVGLLTLL